MQRIRYITLIQYSLLLILLAACQRSLSTPAPSAPVLTVREATNCRTGPGTNYDIVFTYAAGTKLEITGRDESRSFWLVKSEKSPTGTCWMWTGSVDVTGNALDVASVALPLTPTSAPGSTSGGTPPEAPSLQKWDYSCSSDGKLTFTVTWKDKATDETGYRIFRDGELLAELPAASTTYTDTLSSGQNVEYYVQVYSPGGTANSSVMKAGC